MIRFALYCIDRGPHEGKWRFEEHGQGMNVRDPAGVVVSWFAHAKADDRFVLPSFWRSIKNLGFKTDNGTTMWFEPDRRAVARVKDYLDEAVLTRGPEATRGLSKRGWVLLFTGLGALVVSVVGFAVLKAVFGVERRGAYYGLAALALLGIGQTAWGIGTLFRAARLTRLLEDREDGSADRA